jgi:hypothetical protein
MANILAAALRLPTDAAVDDNGDWLMASPFEAPGSLEIGSVIGRSCFQPFTEEKAEKGYKKIRRTFPQSTGIQPSIAQSPVLQGTDGEPVQLDSRSTIHVKPHNLDRRQPHAFGPFSATKKGITSK